MAAVLMGVCARPLAAAETLFSDARPRIIVTTDGEVDDRCSLVRLLLMASDYDIEAIVNSSSQFHWQGGDGWNALHPVEWVEEKINLYALVYENLLLHDARFPSPGYLLSRWKVGNVAAVGEDDIRTEGADLITGILLDDDDPRPIWVQAWGGCNTIARALKTIEEKHPARVDEVAQKLRLFLIWEQDDTYQSYIRPAWEHRIPQIVITDQFDCMAYIWPKVMPDPVKPYLELDWMQQNFLEGHGPLCSSYESQNGAFQAEGDTPAFLHAFPNGLRSTESPAWGGWGGRYVGDRKNVWMDPPPAGGWIRPEGRWGIDASWAKKLENAATPHERAMQHAYFKPIWQWTPAVQNELAARADWCVSDFASANHPPEVCLHDTPHTIDAAPGEVVRLDASATIDPDADAMSFLWWQYSEAGTSKTVAIADANQPVASLSIPESARNNDTLHLVCRVTDRGVPSLTRYARVVVQVTRSPLPTAAFDGSHGQ